MFVCELIFSSPLILSQICFSKASFAFISTIRITSLLTEIQEIVLVYTHTHTHNKVNGDLPGYHDVAVQLLDRIQIPRNQCQIVSTTPRSMRQQLILQMLI